MDLKYLYTQSIYRVRYKLNHRLPLKKIQAQTSPKYYLLGTIEHMNYGDQAINIAENQLFNNSGYTYVGIPESLITEALPIIAANIKPDDVIFCHGGGNMGDVWPEQEKWRQKIFTTFPNNKIIVFPQSVNFKSNSTLLKESVEAASQHPKLTLLMRDKFSYDFVKENYPESVNVKLVPDVVMTLNKVDLRVKRENKVTTFLRRDVEKLSDTRINQLMAELAKKYKIENSDTVSDYWYFINDSNRDAFLNKKLSQFQSSKFIVTDRLHGMVFAAITKTPALVFDNNNHKIQNLYNTWLKNCKYLKFVDAEMDMDKIQETLFELLRNTDFTFEQDVFYEKLLLELPELRVK